MITVCLLAAGKGERTTLSDNKVKYLLDDAPLFMHSYNSFKKLGYKIITVAQKEDFLYFKKIIDTPVIEGGQTRLLSVENALKHVSSKYVLIHDAARPFIKEELILQTVSKLNNYDAVMVAKKPISTYYDKNLQIVNRETLIEAETPQGFLTKKIKEAFKNRTKDNFTDDISVYKSYYKNDKVGIIFHETNNEKITTATSIKRYFMPDYKIGHAYDIHQLVSNRKLILGGILIDYPKGLLGHSDADVLIHAISEAIMGALGIGDLGTHFPDTDIKYKNLNSAEILKYCLKQCKQLDYKIVNIDATIYAEEPKLAPYILKMRKNISQILNINKNQINIKAATNERLDAVGKNLAIASEAVCLLKGYRK